MRTLESSSNYDRWVYFDFNYRLFKLVEHRLSIVIPVKWVLFLNSNTLLSDFVILS